MVEQHTGAGTSTEGRGCLNGWGDAWGWSWDCILSKWMGQLQAWQAGVVKRVKLHGGIPSDRGTRETAFSDNMLSY